MENKCKIIKDLLPLYVEDMLSEESKKFIIDNIEDCPECKIELEELKLNIEEEKYLDSKPLEFLDKEIKKDKRINLFALGFGLLSLFIIFLSYISSPIYFPYSEDLINLTSTEEKHIIEFSEEVTGYNIQDKISLDSEKNEVWIEAWKTPLDSLLPPRKSLTLVIDKPAVLLYSSNNGEVATQLQEGRGGKDFNGMMLPRLAQNYYLMLSIILSGVIGIILYVVKPKPLAPYNFFTIPFSYMLAHIGIFLPRGVNYTYDLTRDFIYIVLLTIAINIFLQLILKIRKRKI